MDDVLLLQYLCLYMASTEAGDISGNFVDMININLAQVIAVANSQLES